MQSRLDPRYYVSQDMFERERTRLFERIWQFFTLKPLVGEHNAFVTRRICGRSIVVQNFHGELCAFDNVCLHRGAELQWASEGVRSLTCRYHGWNFDAEGTPTIPFPEIYRFRDELDGRCLRKYAVRTVGNLVFVNLAREPIELEQQFSSSMIESLRAHSATYSDDIAVTTFHLRFNWKLVYENLRDGNHPRFVHPKTLARTFDFVPGIQETMVADARRIGRLERDAALELLPRLSYHGRDAVLENFQPLEWQHGITERWQPEIGYFNWLAYPNLHIATATGGHAFTLEHHIPTSATTTDIVLYWVLAKRPDPYPQAAAVLYANMLGSQRVLVEDFEVCERVQAGLREGGPRTLLGDYESQNLLIEAFYANLMEGAFGL